MGKTILYIVIIIVIIRIVIRLFGALFRGGSHRKPTATEQGQIGEKKVATILNSLPKKYLVLNNVIVPNQQATSQIDHVVVSPYGIFVIETKNFSGYITGSENGEDWRETFGRAGGNSFRNPIKQNWGHIYALADYLDIDKRAFRPIIVFSNDATLKVGTSTPVIHMAQLKDAILSYNQEIIPTDQIEAIYTRISKANLVGTELGNKHTQAVKETVEQKREAIRQGKCPKCGGKLVLRNGKYGTFYGCSNYPKCKYTNNMRN